MGRARRHAEGSPPQRNARAPLRGPLRKAVASAGGFRISDGFISPLDLIAIGLVSQQEASELHALENTTVGASKTAGGA